MRPAIDQPTRHYYLSSLPAWCWFIFGFIAWPATFWLVRIIWAMYVLASCAREGGC